MGTVCPCQIPEPRFLHKNPLKSYRHVCSFGYTFKKVFISNCSGLSEKCLPWALSSIWTPDPQLAELFGLWNFETGAFLVVHPWWQALKIYCPDLLPTSLIYGLLWKVVSLLFMILFSLWRKLDEGVLFVPIIVKTQRMERGKLTTSHKMALLCRRSPSVCGLGEDAVFQHRGQKTDISLKDKENILGVCMLQTFHKVKVVFITDSKITLEQSSNSLLGK